MNYTAFTDYLLATEMERPKKEYYFINSSEYDKYQNSLIQWHSSGIRYAYGEGEGEKYLQYIIGVVIRKNLNVGYTRGSAE